MLRAHLSVIPFLLASLLSSLALAIHRIFERHRGAKDARLKIAGGKRRVENSSSDTTARSSA
jgi:hypothetical protein